MRAKLTWASARRYVGPDNSSGTTEPDWLRRRRVARDMEPVEWRRPDIEERPGAPQESARSTLSLEDLVIAALPLLIGLVLLLFGFGPGVVKLGS